MWFCQSAEPVVVAGREVADVERDQREPRDLRGLPLREETIGDASLIEHLDRARVQAARARAGDVLARRAARRSRRRRAPAPARPPASAPSVLLRRSPLRDSPSPHRVRIRRACSLLPRARFAPRPGTVRHDRGLAASPGIWHMLEVERGGGRHPRPAAPRVSPATAPGWAAYEPDATIHTIADCAPQCARRAIEHT